jgi:hypothetical protein
LALTRLIEKFDFAQHDTLRGYKGGQTPPLRLRMTLQRGYKG